MSRILVYGANGYTGRLIAEKAAATGLEVVLAGRTASKLEPLAARLKLPWRAFGLDDPQALRRELTDEVLVLHCAGPFSRTSAPMVAACLASQTHYLDITGEIGVFEAVLRQDDAAKQAGVVLLPGVGFDVVPSDCLAASVAQRLPGATALELAFASNGGGASRGTSLTMLENLPRGNWVRRDGKLQRLPAGKLAKQIAFHDTTRWTASIPWGDVSTAFYSTGIPNITVYTGMPRKAIWGLRAARPLMGLTQLGPVQRFLERRIDATVTGPSSDERERVRTELWARAEGPDGAFEATLGVPEGYRHTTDASLECARRVLAGEVEPGAYTPSKAFGADFVRTLPDVEWRLDAAAE
jgi:short subunit dehydrogenase-like uncharacterized protein